MSDAQSELIVQLNDNAVRVIDLFREWDEDGSGAVSKKEFRCAVTHLFFFATLAQCGFL